MFDTHCHLNLPEFDSILGSSIEKARELGVEKFLIPSTNLKNAKKALEIADFYSNVFVAIGIHPTEDQDKMNLDSTITKIEELVEDNQKVIAIGETGLDYYKFTSAASVQLKFLYQHIQLARKLGLSLILHNRQADEDIIKSLEDNWSDTLSSKVVFHCCPPSDQLLQFAKQKRIFIGVDGDITYDQSKQEFIKNVPLDLLVLETDSPYLTPEPLRTAKIFPNKPENLPLIAQKVATIKGISLSVVKEKTLQNSLMLF